MKLISNQINTINFHSGLTKKILLDEKRMKTQKQKNIFTEKYGIETNLLTNSSATLANVLCLNIFEQLSERLNIDLAVPPAIFLYEKENLIDKDSQANFCIPDTKEVLKNEYPFVGRTIFFKNFNNLKEVDENSEILNKRGINSSSHFLAPFIHEWIHSFHLDYIFKTFGYDGDCDYLKSLYPEKQTKPCGIKLLKSLETKKLSSKENEIIYETLGYYSTLPVNQYLEVFSEAFTKFICNSLKDCSLVKNPFSEISKTHPDFQKILQKICSFK